jgi:glycerol-3-phosphate dehydrogenase
MAEIFDLAIIGGGINGCGIARDAAGRGLKVALIEQQDLAGATSSWSSKLIHGGLRYLEQYEFRLVREALQEREVLLRNAPHLIAPLEFVLPHDRGMRPAWMVRIGLWMYDSLGGRTTLPKSRGVRFPHPQYSAALKPDYLRGFVYSDAQVDDSRLTILNALGAQQNGAKVFTRSQCIAANRVSHGDDKVWQLALQSNGFDGANTTIHARGIVNAAGPWVAQWLKESLGEEDRKTIARAAVKLVKGSHIIVPRVHTQPHAYILQNDDARVVFIIPYRNEFSLIGTTDLAIKTIAEGKEITEAETQYLLAAVNRYLAKPLTAHDILSSYAGVRPLFDDGSDNPSEITRDYVLKLDAHNNALPLLSIYGGKITTYRRLAEHALADLAPFFPNIKPAWTHNAALPGGDIASLGAHVKTMQALYTGLPGDFVAMLCTRHGTRVSLLLAGVKSFSDIGAKFGQGHNLLCEREIDFLIRHEWARTPEDILWRRTKCGLHMDQASRDQAAAFITQRVVMFMAA